MKQLHSSIRKSHPEKTLMNQSNTFFVSGSHQKHIIQPKLEYQEEKSEKLDQSQEEKDYANITIDQIANNINILTQQAFENITPNNKSQKSNKFIRTEQVQESVDMNDDLEVLPPKNLLEEQFSTIANNSELQQTNIQAESFCNSSFNQQKDDEARKQQKKDIFQQQPTNNFLSSIKKQNNDTRFASSFMESENGYEENNIQLVKKNTLKRKVQKTSQLEVDFFNLEIKNSTLETANAEKDKIIQQLTESQQMLIKKNHETEAELKNEVQKKVQANIQEQKKQDETFKSSLAERKNFNSFINMMEELKETKRKNEELMQKTTSLSNENIKLNEDNKFFMQETKKFKLIFDSSDFKKAKQNQENIDQLEIRNKINVEYIQNCSGKVIDSNSRNIKVQFDRKQMNAKVFTQQKGDEVKFDQKQWYSGVVQHIDKDDYIAHVKFEGEKQICEVNLYENEEDGGRWEILQNKKK